MLHSSFAQLTGSKFIPGDYLTVTAAVADLNAQGVGAGGVTFEVTAGYTETLAGRLDITATGTLADPIVFRKDPATRVLIHFNRLYWDCIGYQLQLPMECWH
ncbi:MAG: hypothetical protein IPJ26_16270 [Bacteroidetes bacterium]|nr:hypothetical protein [Bacteroidota bacterium]